MVTVMWCSGVMYQHEHATLPLEQLDSLPQPVVVLLEVLLEKDPARRLQTSTELLKAIPTIKAASDARRRITRQGLRKTPATTSSADDFLDAALSWFGDPILGL
jgi:hypothetical protein